MLRKLVTTLIVVPLGIVLVAFAVANRQAVTVSFDLLGSGAKALSATVPLFILVLALLIVGVIAGGVATWFRQRRWRRAAQRLAGEARALRAECAALRVDLSAREQPALPAPAPA